eukprot:TRINITY_DN4586_c0_g2_i2.p2 TRINITY_DN4586_c0_g2~~TRINITY_DN4586_c0_g2_i2.p2  ORF type:complete len:122 (-),score=35.07 TRINITY_DN4586_c0_g2_i2:5-370(-)
MDRLIYTAGSGAKHILEQQATTSNNLANVNTTGFRAQLDVFRAVPIQGEGLPTRAFVVNSSPAADFSAGALQVTGRDLDVAIKGQGRRKGEDRTTQKDEEKKKEKEKVKTIKKPISAQDRS